MKKYRVALVLMALALVAGVGAKMYSTITMGDDEWIGLGANAGRIVFDDQVTDRIEFRDAAVGIATSPSHGKLHVVNSSPGQVIYSVSNSTTGSNYGIDAEATGVGATANYAAFLYATGASTNYNVYAYGSAKNYFGGNVGIKDSTPSYELDVNGDIRATEDVLANGSVFIGYVEDANEDGAHMTTRADNVNGGYVFWAMRNITAGQMIFPDRYASGGGSDVGPETVLWAQWLVRDNTTDVVTEGDAVVTAGSEVLIAGSGANTLELTFWRPVVPPPGVPYKGSVMLTEMGWHNYDATLLMMWIKES